MINLMTIFLLILFICILIVINQLRKPAIINVNKELRSGYTHISHRGASGEAPENTTEAFKIAVEKYRTEVLEMDVHSSKDGVIVVIHDRTLERTTNGKGKVKEHTYEELKRLDAGYWFKKNENDIYLYRGKFITIPSLKEVIENFPGLKFNIEVKQRKPSIEQTVINIIREMGLTNKVILGSSNVLVSRKLKKLAPEIASFCNRWDVILFYILNKLGLSFFYRPKHQAIQTTAHTIFINNVQPSMINTAHKKGMLFHVWTINDESDMEKYLNMGVDGVMTDYPDKLTNVLKKLNKLK